MPNTTSSGELLRRLLAEHNISFRQLERLRGPRRETIRKHLSGEQVLYDKTLLSIFAVLGEDPASTKAKQLLAAVRRERKEPRTSKEAAPTTTRTITQDQINGLVSVLTDRVIKETKRTYTPNDRALLRQEIESMVEKTLGDK